jgi:hypothetical protein
LFGKAFGERAPEQKSISVTIAKQKSISRCKNSIEDLTKIEQNSVSLSGEFVVSLYQSKRIRATLRSDPQRLTQR